MAKIYFTFGSDPRFPYGRNDYVEVEAEDMHQACELFNLLHPPRNEGSNIVNCAFIYSEEKFNTFRDKYYKDVPPIETISVRRRT